FARIAAEEGEHVDHAMSILRAERARDAQRFDDKVYRLHLDVMTTLAQMLAKECKDGHCEVCHASCVKPSLFEVSLSAAELRGASACAIQAGAKIVSLGGFSSILIEGNFDQLPERRGTVFTTGNTLTVAFIVQGIQKMCALEGRNLRRSTLLIVGATGDVGSGCARCLAPIVRRVLLSARKVER